jgi:type IV pilus assembly protein PilW
MKVSASGGSGTKVFTEQGFTLLEVVIAVCIVGLLGASVLAAFQSQRKTHYEQQMIVEMHQNVRAALFMIQRDVRMAGFDPLWQDRNRDGRDDRRGDDGIDNDCDDVFDHEDETLPMGFISAETHRLWFRLDRNADGAFCGSQETVAYGFPRTSGGQAVDDDLDGAADLGAGRLNRGFTKNAGASLILDHPVAEDIQAVAFAYGFDYDAGEPDGRLDMENDRVIWAYDSDGDDRLDRTLDFDGDGVLEPDDDRDGDGFLDGSALEPPVPLSFIRAVRIWVLGRTRGRLKDYRDQGVYVVGDKVITPAAAGDEAAAYRRVLLSTTAVCRNLALRENIAP